MKNEIKKVAVLGSGVMGAQLAAHFSNAGIPALLFDISQEVAEKGKAVASKIKPAAFYNPRSAELIEPCNYDDHLEKLNEVDWVLEAVIERLDIKHAVFNNIEKHLKKNAVVTSNTSGIAIKKMMDGMSPSFQERFFVTHFFNPPRYMRLLEIVPGEKTKPDYVKNISDFCENVLGKGIVVAKDTPNFIANRIGVFGIMLALKLTKEMNLAVEEVDKITGTIVGRPKSATFRTADVVGLDTLAHVAKNTYEFCETDEQRDIFLLPDFFNNMLEAGLFGQKSGKGFYQKVGKDILSIDFDTLEFSPQKKVRFDGYRVARGYHNTADKIKALAYSNDAAGKFFWELLAGTLIYAANRIPEISDDIRSVDDGMKWGFAWELGPFETWDAIGLKKSVTRMQKENKKVPAWVLEMVEQGRDSFYQPRPQKSVYYNYGEKRYSECEAQANTVNLKQLKLNGNELERNWCASIIDMEDGVACLEFHSALQPAMNPIDASILDMLQLSLNVVKDNGFKGLVVGHQGANFSAGANLALILQLCKAKDWQGVEKISKDFQDFTQMLKFADFPVVAAPFNLCLGGGYEAAAYADKIVASAELYCGLVEVGVGLIPGAGGNLRVLLNNMDSLAKVRSGPFPVVQKTFETIGFGKVSSSAKEAVKLGYLKRTDQIVLNSAQLLFEAKKAVLEMRETYVPPEPRKNILLPGEGGRLAIESSLQDLVKTNKISPHDCLIGTRLANVLTGGQLGSPVKPLDEQAILDLEREAFVSLCGEKLSQARMEFMLKKGKPLRN